MADGWRRLTSADIRAFDAQQSALILEMGEHGWIGKVSSKGHAIMRAPDGETTDSITRDSKRARSGRNARASFERWKRLQEGESEDEQIEVTEHTCKQCGEAFESPRALGAHQKKHFEASPCPICGRPVKYLIRHMKVHEGKQGKTLSERLMEIAVEVEDLENQLAERG